MVNCGFCYLGNDKDCLVDLGRISYISGSSVERFKTCITFHGGEKMHTTMPTKKVIEDILNCEKQLS